MWIYYCKLESKTLFWWSTYVPYSSSTLAVSTCPYAHARDKGVLPESCCGTYHVHQVQQLQIYDILLHHLVDPLGLQIPTKPSQLRHSHSHLLETKLNNPSTMAKLFRLYYHDNWSWHCSLNQIGRAWKVNDFTLFRWSILVPWSNSILAVSTYPRSHALIRGVFP